MKAKEARDLSVAEINTRLLALRLRKQTGQVEKTHELRALRKDIARLETIKTQKAA
jgi:large subunit ribosomal protein L29